MKNKGFTFLEVLIVLIILSILVGIVTSFVFSYIPKSRAHEAWENISAFRPSIEACIIKEGSNKECRSVLSDSENFHYMLKINQSSKEEHEQTYTIVASGQNNLNTDDTIQFTYDIVKNQSSCISTGQLKGIC